MGLAGPQQSTLPLLGTSPSTWPVVAAAAVDTQVACGGFDFELQGQRSSPWFLGSRPGWEATDPSPEPLGVKPRRKGALSTQYRPQSCPEYRALLSPGSRGTRSGFSAAYPRISSSACPAGHSPLPHSFTCLASAGPMCLPPALEEPGECGDWSESSRPTEGPRGVPGTAAHVCSQGAHRGLPQCVRARPWKGAHAGSPRAQAPSLALVHTLSQGRRPCAVHNLNTWTRQPSATAPPQAQRKTKSREQKRLLLVK